MIKAVFFDYFNTLAYFTPPRETTYADIANKLGVKVTPEAVDAALPEADMYWRQENFKSPIRERADKDKYPTYTEYGLRILKNAHPAATPEQALQMLAEAFKKGFKFVAYEDSLPALQAVKAKHLKAGLVSNIGQEIDSYCEELGFAPYLDFKVTSFEVGYDKPHPEIFELALQRAGVPADQAIYIGDQYDVDVLGARGVGITPILIDRKGKAGYLDCIIINNLLQIVKYI